MSALVPGGICLAPDFSTTRLLFSSGNDVRTVATGSMDGGLRCRGLSKRALPGLPLLTVATVVYNGAGYIEDTIKSVLAIAYDNVEFIIVDGGSRDGTLDVLRQYEDRLDYWVSARDEGIYDAMNKAWLLASPESTVLFLGCGDRILSLPKKFDAEAIFYGSVNVGDRLFRSTLRYGLRLGNTLHHQALLVPRKMHPVAPFDVRFKVYADFDFNQRLYRSGCEFRYADDFRAYALPGGISERLDVAQMAAVTRKNFGLFSACLTWLYCSYQRFRQAVMMR